MQLDLPVWNGHHKRQVTREDIERGYILSKWKHYDNYLCLYCGEAMVADSDQKLRIHQMDVHVAKGAKFRPATAELYDGSGRLITAIEEKT